MIKLIMVVLSAFCLLLSFCDETNSPSPVGPTDPVKKDTSILIGTWAQRFDTSTIERKEYWRLAPASKFFSKPDTIYYENDSIETHYLNDQLGQRYKDTLYYYYVKDTIYTYNKPKLNSGFQIKADTTIGLFEIRKDTLFFGKLRDTISCLFRL